MKTIMSVIALATVALATTSLLIGTSSQGKLSTSDNFQLSAKAEKETFRRGENIRLKVAIKNISKTLQKLSVTRPEIDYVITVKDEAGANVPMSQYGEGMKNPRIITRNFVEEIKPSNEKQEEISIDKLFIPFKKGIHVLTIQRYVLWEGNKGATITRPITVKIRVVE